LATGWVAFGGPTFTGTPNAVGVYTIEVVCTDVNGFADTETFTITVSANNPPVYTQLAP